MTAPRRPLLDDSDAPVEVDMTNPDLSRMTLGAPPVANYRAAVVAHDRVATVIGNDTGMFLDLLPDASFNGASLDGVSGMNGIALVPPDTWRRIGVALGFDGVPANRDCTLENVIIGVVRVISYVKERNPGLTGDGFYREVLSELNLQVESIPEGRAGAAFLAHLRKYGLDQNQIQKTLGN